MDQPEQTQRSWLDSLRRTGDSLLALAQTRFELMAVELQEEKLRALNLLVWLAVALMLGVTGLLVALGALAIFLWSAAGYWGLISLAAVSLGAGAFVLRRILKTIQTEPPPFNDTIGEFRKDFQCLRDKR